MLMTLTKFAFDPCLWLISHILNSFVRSPTHHFLRVRGLIRSRNARSLRTCYITCVKNNGCELLDKNRWCQAKSNRVTSAHTVRRYQSSFKRTFSTQKSENTNKICIIEWELANGHSQLCHCIRCAEYCYQYTVSILRPPSIYSYSLPVQHRI